MFKKKTKTKKVGHYEFGGFIADFYTNEGVASENKLCITTVSKNFSMTLTDYTFGYLLASVRGGDTEELHSFCAMLYWIGTGIYQDIGFANDIMKGVTKYFKRLEKRAESEAKRVTEAEEQGAQAMMEGVIEYAESDDESREKIQADDREIMKEILGKQTGKS